MVRMAAGCQRRDGGVQPFAYGVEVAGEQARVHVQRHGCGRVAEMRCTALTLAPDATARLAAVCRSTCGVTLSRPAAVAAGSNTRRRKFELRTARAVRLVR